MSKTNRWYTFSRKIPLAGSENRAIEPGTVYEVYGWSRTKEAALAKRDNLDRAGRSAINIFAASLQQAMADVMEVYPGVVVDGYISPANRRAGRQIVKTMVMREIFCPYTGVILDMRRAVVVVTPTRIFVCASTYWDECLAKVGGLEGFKARVSERLHRNAVVSVYDGRELFKR